MIFMIYFKYMYFIKRTTVFSSARSTGKILANRVQFQFPRMYATTKFCGQTAQKSFSLSRRYLRQNETLGTLKICITPIINRDFLRGPERPFYYLRIASGRPDVIHTHSWGQSNICSFHTSTSDHEEDKPSSKIEESVNVIKADLKDKVVAVAPKRSLWKRIEDEILHYYHGFRLLLVDTKICMGLIYRVLNGHHLTRREHRQLVRTTADLFRLLPFSVFIIVPFMELLLPVFLKFFPGMLPSTFQTKNDRDTKMKAQLKVKLEMAKFLQKTLDDMSLESKGHSSENAKEFALFFQKIRVSGSEVSNSDIIKFSKLFEDEITLDSLSRQQLTALCRVLEIPAIGNNTLLRFLLRMRLRNLVADDKAIEQEGINSLNVSELQMACKARGMRAVGVSEDRLRRQLEQWLQLSLHEKVPSSLLLLSRALYLPENLPASAVLQATISALPEAAATQAKGAIGEREGKVDNKTRIEIIKEEERKISEERQDALLDASKKAKQPVKDEHIVETPAAVPDLHTEQVSLTLEKREDADKHEHATPKLTAKKAAAKRPEAPFASEMYLDKVHEVKQEPITVSETVGRRLSRHVPHPVADLHKDGVTKEDLTNIGIALAKLSSEKEVMFTEKEEIKDLKDELADYKEDLEDLNVLKNTGDHRVDVKESKAAQRLYKRVNKMILKMDTVVSELQKEESVLKAQITHEDEAESKQSQLIATEKLIEAIQKFRTVSDPARLERIAEVIGNLDADRDGHIEIDDVMKVIELIGRENVNLHPKQVAEIVEILSKEERKRLSRKAEAQNVDRMKTSTDTTGSPNR